MNTLTLDEVLLISLAIKIVVGAILSLFEIVFHKKFEKMEKPILVLVLFAIALFIEFVYNIDYKSALNVFFYTLGIDNIAEYSKKSISDFKNGNALK